MVDVVAIGTGLLFTAIGLGLVIVGALVVRYGRREQRRSNRLSETETTEIDFLEPGTVEIKGTARPVEDGATVEGPLSGDEALVTTVEVDKRVSTRHGSSWQTIHDDETVRPFRVDDGTGEVRVDPPRDANVALDVTRTVVEGDEEPPEGIRRFVQREEAVDAADEGGLISSGEKRRYGEGLIEPGEDVYVFGHAVEESGDAWGEHRYVITDDDALDEFLLSDRSEEELTSGKKIGAVILYAVGGFLLLLGLPFTLIALVFLLATLL